MNKLITFAVLIFMLLNVSAQSTITYQLINDGYAINTDNYNSYKHSYIINSEFTYTSNKITKKTKHTYKMHIVKDTVGWKVILTDIDDMVIFENNYNSQEEAYIHADNLKHYLIEVKHIVVD